MSATLLKDLCKKVTEFEADSEAVPGNETNVPSVAATSDRRLTGPQRLS
jgi:hypothetical protein